MQSATAHRPAATLWFVALAAGIYTAALIIAGQLPRVYMRADTVAAALTLDLVVVVPVAFYVLVVRHRAWPVVTLAPVFLLSLIAASRVLPADQHSTLRIFEVLAVPVELGLLALIGWRAARGVRHARRDAHSDPLERIRRAAAELTHNSRAAAILATEIAVFYYPIASWSARPHVPAGTRPFAQHRRAGHAATLLAVILLMIVEGLAVHVLLQSWSLLAAWVVTSVTAYGAMWLIADYRLTVLRPTLVGPDAVIIRAGLRCTLRVRLEQIAAIGRVKPGCTDGVNLTFLGRPTHWLTFTEPIEAEGPYGFKRLVRAIGFAPDEADDFVEILAR